MFLLLTTLLLLASGKTLCQERIVTQRFTTELSPVQSSRAYSYSTRDFNRRVQLQPTPQPFLYTRQSTEKFKEDLLYSRNNTSRATVTQPARVNQQKRRLLISRVITQRVNRNQLVNTPTNNTRDSTSSQVNMDVYDKVKFEEDPPLEINSVNSNGTASRNVTPQPSVVPDDTSKKPVTKPVTPAPGNVTEVTLDERSSFDGDQCPTGYVRVNGMCVQPD